MIRSQEHCIDNNNEFGHFEAAVALQMRLSYPSLW